MQLLRNSRGQTAIFIALIFQVLFVLFAMALNIGLVVHDKINLQNSVDLAAYYAAERQAEELNAIAHINYQIRQSWKLLAFRYRVLGTLGFDRPTLPSFHPARSGVITEMPYLEAVRPSTCVNYKPNWDEVAPNQNLCNQPNLVIPPLPQVPVIAGFIGINLAVAALSTQLINAFNAACDQFGAYNWWFAAGILQNYRIEQRNRKLLIYALANNLSTLGNDFVDLNGDSVLAGAQQTFRKNLTYANSVSTTEFQMLNSLSGVDPKVWLPEIKISPTILYTDVTGAAGCAAHPQLIRFIPERFSAQNKLKDPKTLNGGPLIPWMQGEPPPTDPYSFSLGVEKNPWIMAYVGIKATTKPRQIFFPIGPNVTLTARAFAQPFGGRIGPWHGSQWPTGSAQSIGQQIDALVPVRTKADGFLDSPNDPSRLPNYARFPGDALGLISRLSQGALTGVAYIGMRYAYFMKIYYDFINGASNDSLAWDYQADKIPDYRYYELAAVAPDLFDATYYSIEPNFAQNYMASIVANRQKLKIPDDLIIRGDLGTHAPQMPAYGIQNQISDVQTKNIQGPTAFYFVRKRENILTAWAPGEGAVNYGMPYDRFGHCRVPDDNLKDKVPGSCVGYGGRTGYSVKLVNRNGLNSVTHSVGGTGVPPGPLVNPPKAFSGW